MKDEQKDERANFVFHPLSFLLFRAAAMTLLFGLP
jgi:hypothetical protein